MRSFRRERCLRKTVTIIGLLVIVMAAGCGNSAKSNPADDAPPVSTVSTAQFLAILPEPGGLLEQERNRLAADAVSSAMDGCLDTPTILIGPTRVSYSITNFAKATDLAHETMDFPMGPGGSGAPDVWVIVVEGRILKPDTVGGQQSLESAAFVFVVPVTRPVISGCVLRDSPFPEIHELINYGAFELEVIFHLR
jgi:hypothetical protein